MGTIIGLGTCSICFKMLSFYTSSQLPFARRQQIQLKRPGVWEEDASFLAWLAKEELTDVPPPTVVIQTTPSTPPVKTPCRAEEDTVPSNITPSPPAGRDVVLPWLLDKCQGRCTLSSVHLSIYLPAHPSISLPTGQSEVHPIRGEQNFNTGKGHRINNSFKVLAGIDHVIAL